MQTSRPTRSQLFGRQIDPLSMPDVLRLCTDAVHTRQPLVIGMVNAAKIVGLRDDARLRGALDDCDLVLADGQSVVWASRLLGAPLPERVAGIDLFTELLRVADGRGWRVFLLGATSEVLADLLSVIATDYPGVVVAGARNGYFVEAESDAVAEQIAASRADLLFVGMTSPRKELFLQRYGAGVVSGVAHGVGGSFDVVAGHTARAPMLWQRLGLEWLYRVWQEPRRLWRRYLFSNGAFLRLVAQEAWAGRRRVGRVAPEALLQPGQPVEPVQPVPVALVPPPRTAETSEVSTSTSTTTSTTSPDVLSRPQSA